MNLLDTIKNVMLPLRYKNAMCRWITVLLAIFIYLRPDGAKLNYIYPLGDARYWQILSSSKMNFYPLSIHLYIVYCNIKMRNSIWYAMFYNKRNSYEYIRMDKYTFRSAVDAR